MCNCIEITELALAELNTRIVSSLIFNWETNAFAVCILIPTEKANNKIRQGPVKLLATYCPICGEKYPVSSADPGEAEGKGNELPEGDTDIPGNQKTVP